jgi:hypothetical protein
MARLVATPMSRALGQPVVVENTTGAGGTIGATRVARAAPDGHTLLFAHVGVLAVNPHLYNHLQYDPQKDFSAVGLAGTNQMVLLVSEKSGITTLEQFRERARRGELVAGTAGTGTTTHLGALQALAAAGKIVELSTAGWRRGLGAPFPAPWILRRCRDLGIRVTPCTDAHHPEQIAYRYADALALLRETGYREVAVLDPASGHWTVEALLEAARSAARS